MTAANGGDSRGAGGSCGPENRHVPVLLDAVLTHLAPHDGGHYVDGTFGAGGYTRAILDAADCRVSAFDRDPQAVHDGSALVQHYQPRLTLTLQRFGNLETALAPQDSTGVDGVVFDIGVSSMQLDQAERGFSFQHDGPLDMRMFAYGDRDDEQRPTAADLVNTLDQNRIADILYHFGEERRARAIAAAIVLARSAEPLTRTSQLADLCARVYGRRPNDGIHPATRTFQALRIAVNDELGELARGLAAAERILSPGGRLVIVTFHSLEDRIVKRFLAARSGKSASTSRHLPEMIQFDAPSFQIINQRPLRPSNQEIASNPRARSAKLRWAVRTEAPAHELDPASLGVPHVDLD
ncbi:MAG: 16S rRNA (cytosine(1402)-N(4))-methyltransferase RsmH [Hyphomicrobiaceae bacterium]